MSDAKVRVRFAPSPTGDPHVGNIRTALFNYLFARHQGGEFLVRIEDTDQARKVAGSDQSILESLAWLGLEHDGEVIRQSDRLKEYQSRAAQLVKEGKAYYCTCSAERLKKLRDKQRQQQKPPRYDRHCLGQHQQKPTQAVVRFLVPEKIKPFRDELRGMVDIAASEVDDFVIIKSDGYPTYNFANAIDDHNQGISHVIRGEEFLSSTPKHLLVYQAFGWPAPKLVHLPAILGPDKGKLSKRHGAAPVLEYRGQGYLPEALLNFLALLGWRGDPDRELYSKAELIKAFSLKGLQTSPAVFDDQKLRWLNGQYMKNFDTGELLDRARQAGFWKGDDLTYDAKVVRLVAERADTLAELGEARHSYFYQEPKLTKKQLTGGENLETVGVWLERVQRSLRALPDWREETIENTLNEVREELGLVPKQLYPVLREALTSEAKTPALWEVMAVLGQEKTLARLEKAASLVS